MQTIAQRLTEVETSLRRWHTRLKVAGNKIQKLERQRRRLMAQPKTGTPLPELDRFFRPEPKQITQIAACDVPAEIAKTSVKPVDLSIPPELKREPNERPRGHFALADMAGTIGPAIRESLADERTKKRLAKNDLKRRPPSRLIQKALDARDAMERK